MRIFVTGGNGQLGRAVAEVCRDSDLHLGSRETDDITRPAIAQTILQFKPDVVIHAAALTDVDACELEPDRAFLVNEQGTRHVAEGAKRSGALMVYISTDYVFDGTRGTPYLETDTTNPINVYGQSKLAGEKVAQEGAGRWLIVRTSWVYGEGRKNFVASVQEWARTQPVLRLVKDKVGSPTRALDLAQAIRHLVGTGLSNKIVHVSGEGECNWVEYGREILKIVGLQKEIEPITFDELHRPARRPAYSVLKNTELNKAGFTMRPWKTALEMFLKPKVVS
ncbi:MAG: dTDP-4-dehydrorhamnose reductase [Nitrospirae bacterium]|nr:dTDP-4-dehydrorhamnose reductase [Nitrospirota bacterium]